MTHEPPPADRGVATPRSVRDARPGDGAALAALVSDLGYERSAGEATAAVAAIGPGICGRCYEVGDEVATQFDARYVNPGAGGKWLLDLAALNRAQLEAAGAEAVYDIGICTKEHYLFPSHRRHPDGTRFGAIVALR